MIFDKLSLIFQIIYQLMLQINVILMTWAINHKCRCSTYGILKGIYNVNKTQFRSVIFFFHRFPPFLKKKKKIEMAYPWPIPDKRNTEVMRNLITKTPASCYYQPSLPEGAAALRTLLIKVTSLHANSGRGNSCLVRRPSQQTNFAGGD